MAKQTESDDKETISKFLKMAVEEAENGVLSNEGHPFGAVVVKDGEILIRAHNEYLKNKDPTDHKKLDRADLKGCILYSSCEPCPMCFCACLWTQIDKVYYAADQQCADEAGFGVDAYQCMKDPENRSKLAVHVRTSDDKRPFNVWLNHSKK